jgi:hypothetical protein
MGVRRAYGGRGSRHTRGKREMAISHAPHGNSSRSTAAQSERGLVGAWSSSYVGVVVRTASGKVAPPAPPRTPCADTRTEFARCRSGKFGQPDPSGPVILLIPPCGVLDRGEISPWRLRSGAGQHPSDWAFRSPVRPSAEISYMTNQPRTGRRVPLYDGHDQRRSSTCFAFHTPRLRPRRRSARPSGISAPAR